MIAFPKTVAAATAAEGTLRAGGTDLQERRRSGISSGPLVDLGDLAGLDTIALQPDGSLRIGARVTIQQLAAEPQVREGWPAIAAAAGGLATPAVRSRGTVGGNLVQQVRCWYYRGVDTVCLKKGGVACLARQGDHLLHACFDRGPCVCPHPSTMAAAFLAFDATVAVAADGAEPRTLTLPELLGDGTDPTRSHTLTDGELITHVTLPPAVDGEHSAYFRATSRSRAEWPLVEVIVRLALDEAGTVASSRVVLGGVANTPLPRPECAVQLDHRPPAADNLARAAEIAARGANPLPMTRYKVRIIPGAVLETLERALATPAAVGTAPAAGAGGDE